MTRSITSVMSLIKSIKLATPTERKLPLSVIPTPKSLNSGTISTLPQIHLKETTNQFIDIQFTNFDEALTGMLQQIDLANQLMNLRERARVANFKAQRDDDPDYYNEALVSLNTMIQSH